MILLKKGAWFILDLFGVKKSLTLCSPETNQNDISGGKPSGFASRPAVKQAGLGQEVIQHRLFQAGAAQTWIIGPK